MYPTSNDYKTAIRASDRPYNTVYGTITLSNGSTITVNDSVMPTNAVSISKQCIDGDELMFGGVFASILKLSIFTNQDRYAFFGANIKLNYKIQIGISDNQPVYEPIPLGVFTIADADRPSDIVNLTAYDNMTMLDGSIGGNVISGTPWEVFQRVSTDTGIELAFEEEDLEDFVNYGSNRQVECSQDQGIKTYRDVVKVVCQQMGCFAYADRLGKLAVKNFSTTPDLELTYADWYSCVPADYESKYIGLSVTGLQGTFTATTSDPSEQGNVMTIEDAPAWDYGSTENLTARTSDLFTYLHGIIYTPSNISMPSDPTFDCGDMLKLTLKDGSILNTLITSYEWKFHQGMTVVSEGANPYMTEAVVDPQSQRILQQAVAKSKLQFVHFTNPSEVTIGDEEDMLIASVEFTPTADTDALFVATILVEADVEDETETSTDTVEVPVTAYDAQRQATTITDINGNPVTLTGTATNTMTYFRDGKCDVSIYYKLNMQIVPSSNDPYIAVEHLDNGKHIITVTYPITGLDGWVGCDWEIYMTVNGGSITIPANSIRASIFGQEIDIVNRFDGHIKASDTIALTDLVGRGLIELTDEGEITLTGAAYIAVSDNISLYNVDSMESMPLYEGTGALQPQIITRGDFDIGTEDENYLSAEDGFRFITE